MVNYNILISSKYNIVGTGASIPHFKIEKTHVQILNCKFILVVNVFQVNNYESSAIQAANLALQVQTP